MDVLSALIHGITDEDIENQTAAQYEKTVANSFLDYIKIELFLDIPIHKMYRIFNIHKANKGFENPPQEIFEFMLKYLKKHGRDASILFVFVDFNSQQGNYLMQEIINDHSDIFDFGSTDFSKTDDTNEVRRKFIENIERLKYQASKCDQYDEQKIDS